MLSSLFLTAWNELGAVRHHRQRHWIRDRMVRVEAASLDRIHEGLPVFLTGDTATVGRLEDPEFQVRFDAVHLRRIVERYQWIEELQADDAPAYRTGWSAERIDSSGFVQPEGHRNPDSTIPHGPWRDTARKVTVGSYRLSHGLVRALDSFEQRLPDTATPPDGWSISGRALVDSDTPGDPAVGDIRVLFEVVPTGTVTVLARQEGVDLYPLQSLDGTVPGIHPGVHGPEDLLPPVPPPRRIRNNAIRIAAFLLGLSGLRLLSRSLGASPGRLARPGARPPRAGILLPALAAGSQLLVAALVWISRAPAFGLAALGIVAAGIARLVFLLLPRSTPAE